MLARAVMLERFLARDVGAVRSFVVGVVSTGIYCVPTCPARRPRPENVRFFGSVEEARAAGLRPCLRCRPDDVHAERDVGLEVVEELVGRVRREPAGFGGARELARAAGVGTTKLVGLLREHFHASPREVLERARVERALEELVVRGGGVLEAGLAAGFESSSTFHAAFRRRTGLAPGEARALGRARGEGASFVLALPRGYRVQDVLAHLGRDPGSVVERVERTAGGGRFARAIWLHGDGGEPWAALLTVEIEGGAARCTLEAPRRTSSPTPGATLLTLAAPGRPAPPESAARARPSPSTLSAPRGPSPRALAAPRRPSPRALVEALGVVQRLLGLGCDPRGFERRAAREPRVAALVRGREGLRVLGTADVWEGLVWTIVGQQVSLPVAFACRRRLTLLLGEPVGGGLHALPPPERVAELEEADAPRLGLSRRKLEYLRDVARAAVAGELDLEGLARGSATRAERTLAAVRGLGPWSVGYLLLRACGFADCVPAGDAGLSRALQLEAGLDHRPDARETRERMASYAPHRSLASFHLWQTLGGAA